jgi:hypothetical protein
MNHRFTAKPTYSTAGMSNTLLFQSSNAARNDTDSPENKEKKTSDGRSDGDKDANRTKMFIAMFAFPVVLIITEWLFSNRDQRIRELEAELRKRESENIRLRAANPAAVNANQTSALAPPTTEPQLSGGFMTVITWQEFVSQFLSKGLVEEVTGSRDGSIAAIKLKTPITTKGQKRDILLMKMPPGTDLEEKLNHAQDELNLRPEDRVHFAIKDSAVPQFLRMLFYAGLFYLLFTMGRGLMNRVASMQSSMFSQMTKANYTVVDPHLKSGVPKVILKRLLSKITQL